MISIIIPVYNQANKLIKCLNSIRFQTLKDLEVIIVNDGSTDDVINKIGKFTLELEKSNENLSIKVITQENRGAPFARNRGFSESNGEFVIFCDADIVMKEDMLEIMLDTLNNNKDISYCYSSFYFGKKLFKLCPFNKNKLKEMPYIHTTSLIRREHFLGFDENIKKFQDWDLWLTMLENNYHGIWIDKVLFRVETGGTISNWLPAFAYKYLTFLSIVKKYNEAMSIIKQKHIL